MLEYRIEYIHFNGSESPTTSNQLVEQLNAWGRQGWRVANIDLDARPQFGPPTRPVLLVRETAASGLPRDEALANATR